MRRPTADTLTWAFALGACASVALLCWFGYRAVAEWRTKSLLLAERQASDTADLLLTAINRDMSGVQTSVLTSPQWNQFAVGHPHEVNQLVASAFARYPYPDSFFAWKVSAPFEKTVFFYRAERRPAWIPPADTDLAFPVIIVPAPAAALDMMRQIQADAATGRSLSCFEVNMNGVRSQVIAQLIYSDTYRQQLATVIGFTTDLAWVRQHYFADLTSQIQNIARSGEAGLAVHVLDQDGALVEGSVFDEAGSVIQRRAFDLIFADPQATTPGSSPYVPQTWSLAVSGVGSAFLVSDSIEANRVLALAAVSSLVFATGLILIARAVRANAQLTTMRSDFVSAVTHELKTPIATIRAAAETLAKDRLTGMSVRTCGRIVMMETRRLTRLVENLLAYARMTEVTDTYSLKPVEVAAIFKDIQDDFEAPLDRHGFELHLNIAPDVHSVLGDRFALRLLFGNLVDNAIKYSHERRTVTLSAASRDKVVLIEITDGGVGIPAEELSRVVRKFVRANGATGGGSGLGLAIASRIAADHGGQLDIASTVGVGTTVTVTIPASQRAVSHVV